MRTNLFSSCCALAIAVVSGASVGHTAAFQLKETNTVALGHAFSGTSSKAGEPSLQFNNPALLVTSEGTKVDADIAYVIPSTKFRPSSGSGTGTRGGNGGKAAVIPVACMQAQFANNFFFGLSVESPWGLETHWKDENWIGRYNALKSRLTTVSINPAVAYRKGNFGIGMGIAFEKAEVELSNMAIVRDLNTTNPTTHKASINGRDLGAGFSFGLWYDFGQGTMVGLAYRSKISHGFSGTMKAQGAHAKVTAELTVPDTIDFSISHQCNEDWTLHGTALWTHWSVYKRLSVIARENVAAGISPTGQAITKGATLRSEPQSFSNAFFLALGAEYRFCPGWTLQFGAAYDQSPISDAHRSARLPGNDRTWASIGLRYDFSDQAKLSLSYSHLFIRNGRIDQRDTNSNQRIVGRFKNKTDVIGFNFSYKF